MADLENYLIVSPRHFEPMSRYEARPDYLNLLKRVLPADWGLSRHQVWLGANPPGVRPPDQGFKIHVSATVTGAPETLERVARICCRANTSFKVAAEQRLLGIMNAKRCPRGSGGKFMTVYPQDQQSFVSLIEEIHQATRDSVGPYILSDRRYKDSKVVFYRYGGFLLQLRMLPSGVSETIIVDQNGAPVNDTREAYFVLPDGVVDPFAEAEEEDASDDHAVLQDRFEIVRALAFSNSGGTYAAIDRETGANVVVKEARPYTHAWSSGTVSFDAVTLLHREYQVLTDLRDIGAFPRPIALFQQWEHWFMVEEFVPGEPLLRFRAHDNVALMVHIRDPEHVATFVRAFRTVAKQLISILEQVHARGILLADISPSNVLIDPTDFSVRCIDLESAVRADDPHEFALFARAWYTAGYRDPSRHGTRELLTARDDWYALGMLLLSLVIPLEGLIDMSPNCVFRFLDRFVDAGLDHNVRSTITSLLAGDGPAALKFLDS